MLKSIHELARYALALEPAPMGAGHRKVGSAGHLCRGQVAVSSDLHFFNEINHNHVFCFLNMCFIDILGNLVPCIPCQARMSVGTIPALLFTSR